MQDPILPRIEGVGLQAASSVARKVALVYGVVNRHKISKNKEIQDSVYCSSSLSVGLLAYPQMTVYKYSNGRSEQAGNPR